MSTWTECLATLLMQSVFALKTLRAHGLNRECLHNVFNAVILAKLTNGVSAWIGFIRAAEIERLLKHSSVAVNVLNCVPQKQKLQKSVRFMTISYSATSYVIYVISSTNYFRHSPKLQKTAASDHANITDCFQNVLHVSLMLILFTEFFIVTLVTVL